MNYVVVYHIYHAGNDVWQVSVRSLEVLQMVGEVEALEGPSAQWRRGGRVGRELKRLQQRVRNTLDDWLDYYRVAIGIFLDSLKCLMCAQTANNECDVLYITKFACGSKKQKKKKVTLSPHLANSTLLNSSIRILFTVTRVTRCLCTFLSDLFVSFRDQMSRHEADARCPAEDRAEERGAVSCSALPESA